MLEGIRTEIEYNLTGLGPFVAMHADWVEALDAADRWISPRHHVFQAGRRASHRV